MILKHKRVTKRAARRAQEAKSKAKAKAKRLQEPLSVHSQFRFNASGSGAVHIFKHMIVFTRGLPVQLLGSFSFSLLEIVVVLENGALGGLNSHKNYLQEIFF